MKRRPPSPRAPSPDTVVVDDPTTPLAPFGCITAVALRALADAIDALENWHTAHAGKREDHPCLRRIESSGDGRAVAHISIGPAVGGNWERLELRGGLWLLAHPVMP